MPSSVVFRSTPYPNYIIRPAQLSLMGRESLCHVRRLAVAQKYIESPAHYYK